MDIYVEFIFGFVILLMFLSWRIWFKRSKKKLIKQYDPELDMSGETHNDRKQKGGVFNTRGDGETDKGTNAISIDSIGHEQSERPELLQKTDVSNVGEDSISPGKDNNVIRRRFFRKRNK